MKDYYQQFVDAAVREMLKALAEGREDHAYSHAKVAAHNARGIIDGRCSCGDPADLY